MSNEPAGGAGPAAGSAPPGSGFARSGSAKSGVARSGIPWGRFALPGLLVGGVCAIGFLLGDVSLLFAVLVMAAALAAAWAAGPAPLAAEEAAQPRVSPPAPRPVAQTPVGAVVAGLPEPALLLTPNCDILTINALVGPAIGPARVGDPLSFLVRVPEVVEAAHASGADGLPRRVEFGVRLPVDRWLEAHIVPLRLAEAGRAGAAGGLSDAPAGPPDTVLLTFRDLTQQRRVERMRADFVANASHELRTPLASLSGFIETLQGPARNDVAARERFLAIMGAQARRMSRLIDDLLSLSRVELNVHMRPETPVELGAIVAHVCETLTPLARERGVALKVTRERERILVPGERDELIRLFENLVENALKYGATGQQVDVTVREEGEGEARQALVTVRDYGPGIAPEHLPRLTERFYRVDVAASRDQGGTGLGLAIVKHIVARHRGRLAIDSEPGRGALFSVRIGSIPEIAENPALPVA